VLRRLVFFKTIYAIGGLMHLPRFLADLVNRRRQARYAFSGGNTPVDPS
jgi:ribose/xylose/arabinose/galactoside ABC-type transport system permease subunit